MRQLIDAYLGGIVDIANVGKSEIKNFYFECQEELEGTFAFKIWDSEKKNEEHKAGTITKDVNKLTFTVDATTMNLEAKMLYYEIYRVENKQIYFKGKLEIID